MIKKLTYENYDAIVKENTKPLILEFYSPDCTHCKRLESVLDELSNELDDVSEFAKCDISEEPSLASMLDITTVPTLLFIKKGEVKEKLIGFTHKLIIHENIKKLI